MADKTAARKRKEQELELLRLRQQQATISARPVEAEQPGLPEQVGEERPSILQRVGDVVPEFVGGSLAAAKAVGRRTGVGALAVGLGTAGGEAVRQIGQQAEALTGIDIPLVRGEEAPRTSLEAAKRIGTSFVSGAAGEPIARGGVALIGRFAPKREFIKSVTPEGKEAIETLRPLGVTPSIAQVTESRGLDILQNFAEGSFFGGQRVTAQARTAAEATESLIEDFANAFRGTKKEKIGILARDAIEQKTVGFQQTGRGLYRVVDDIIGTEAVDFTPVKAIAQTLLEQEKAGLRSASTRQILKTIVGKPNNIPFEEAQVLRSDLLSVTRQTTDLVPGKAAGIAGKLANETDTAMRTSAENVSPEALNAYLRANRFWRAGKERFNDTVIKKLANSDPDVLVDTVIKQRNASSIRRIRKTINNEEAWKQVQGEYLRGIIERASDPITGELSAKGILNRLKPSVISEDALKELFPRGEINTFKKFARVLGTIQRKQPTGVGRLAVEISQTGAALSLVAGKRKLAAAGIILGPLGLARVMTNPRVVNFMLTGSKGVRTAEQATKYISRLGVLLEKENIEFEMESRKEAEIEELEALTGVQ